MQEMCMLTCDFHIPDFTCCYELHKQPWTYTGYAGIAVKFGTAHDRSRPEVGSGFRIDAYGRKRVSSFSRNFDTSQQKNTPPTDILRPIPNFYSLTVCRLEQYLQKGTEIKVLPP